MYILIPLCLVLAGLFLRAEQQEKYIPAVLHRTASYSIEPAEHLREFISAA